MTAAVLEEHACLACGADLSWRLAGHLAEGGEVALAPVHYTLLVADGVRFKGRVDEDDPAYGVVVARTPFCRACYDAAPVWGVRADGA